ncbi:MAG: hypothetical protein Q9182_004126 [Xanthomendoza sp. 2 TL-2023]
MVFQPMDVVTLIAISLVIVLFYRFLVYPLCFDPLAKVPNAHWSSPFSPLWILATRYSRRELHDVRQAHERLGPIVRLGPKDISISCFEDGIRSVYHKGFDKPAWYDFFNYFGIATVYAKSALFKSSQLLAVSKAILLDVLVPRLNHDAGTSQPTELLELSYSMCLDLVNAYLFGLTNGSKFLKEEEHIKAFLEHYENRYCAESFWPQELPLLTRSLEKVGIKLLPKSAMASKKCIEAWLMEMSKAADASMQTADKMSEDCADFPTVYACVKGATSQQSSGKDVLSIQSEIAKKFWLSHTKAIGLVLGYTLYYLAQNPTTQDRLRAEVASVAPEMQRLSSTLDPLNCRDRHLPSPETLDELPYLSAIINESLRMRPNSTPLPRITPDDRSVTLVGIEGIPPGVRVNAFQWFVHRDPKKWDRVDEWVPERWLDGDGRLRKGSGESQMWGFCSGPRMCAGSNFSQYRESLLGGE